MCALNSLCLASGSRLIGRSGREPTRRARHARVGYPRLAALFVLGIACHTALSFRATADIITTCAGGGTNGNFSNTIGFPATNADFNANRPSIAV
jgi:hypothetical protein